MRSTELWTSTVVHVSSLYSEPQGKTMAASKSVLFVCLGNICRSPMAETILKKQLADQGLEEQWIVDSAALGPWHVGEPPDPRTIRSLKRHGLKTSHRGRMVREEDFQNFDYILCMDHDNMRDLKELQPKGSKAILELLGSYDPRRGDTIEDPYDLDEEKFERTYTQVREACSAFLRAVTIQ